jgi:hypothetical protein
LSSSPTPSNSGFRGTSTIPFARRCGEMTGNHGVRSPARRTTHLSQNRTRSSNGPVNDFVITNPVLGFRL